MQFIVTTSRHPDDHHVERAQALATELELPYVPRLGRALTDVDGEDADLRGVVVVRGDGLRVLTSDGPFFYHPGLAKTRIAQLRQGHRDPMIAAMDLGPGDRVLDCTLGLASDALVASYVGGVRGRVLGLESIPIMAYVVKDGLQTYDSEDPGINAAMRRIAVRTVDYRFYLQRLPEDSFDVVYFDPMFKSPILDSQQMAPLRTLANPAPLDGEALLQARGVARRRIVIKNRRGESSFKAWHVDEVIGGESSQIAYGIIYCSSQEV